MPSLCFEIGVLLSIIERTHNSVVAVVVGVGGVLDADSDGERAAGAHPATVRSAGRVEAPGDGADDEHEGAARADQGPRVGTVLFDVLYVFLPPANEVAGR